MYPGGKAFLGIKMGPLLPRTPLAGYYYQGKAPDSTLDGV